MKSPQITDEALAFRAIVVGLKVNRLRARAQARGPGVTTINRSFHQLRWEQIYRDE